MDLRTIDDHDEAACYAALLELLRPGGLQCPRCGARRNLGIHRRRRAPVVDYRCSACGRVFNAWAGTAVEKTHHRPTELYAIVRAILDRRSTAGLARDLGCQRSQLQHWRRRLQPLVWAWAKDDSHEEGVLFQAAAPPATSARD